MAAGTQATTNFATLTNQQFSELQKRWLGAGDGDEDTRLANRFLCVMLAGRNNWDATQVSSFTGIPEQIVGEYLQAYAKSGIEGLGRDPPSGESFYPAGRGS